MTNRRLRTAVAAAVLTGTTLTLLPASTLAAAAPATAETKSSADVVIVGAGTSGIAAALAARSSGAARVTLLDANDYLGGQVAAGVGTIDEGGADRRDQRQEGVWGRITAAMTAEYRKAGWPHASTCYGAASAGLTLCSSPSIARRVYTRLLADAGVTVRLGVDTLPVMAGSRITGVHWDSILTGAHGTVAAPVVIDATETGDLLAATGKPYRSGNGLGNAPGSQPGGHIQDITAVAVVRKYAAGSMPSNIDLTGKPFPLPIGQANPDLTRTRILAAFAERVAPGGVDRNATTGEPWSPLWHLQYRGLPDPKAAPYVAKQTSRITRTALNYANDFPNESVGDLGGNGLPVRYLEDRNYRHQVDCLAKMRTIQFVWYMQNVLGQPDWSVATDEGFNTPYNKATRCSGIVGDEYHAFEANMPAEPYVRESRRGIGQTTMTPAQVKRVPTGEPTSGPYGTTSPLAAATQPLDTVAIGYYRNDLHGGRAPEDFEPGLDNPSDVQVKVNGNLPYGPFGIPLSALVARDVTGLILAEKNISQSRIVNGSTRLQPETSMTGTAAGVLAALASRRHVAPAAVPARDVQLRLVRLGQYPAINHFLDLPRTDPATPAFEIAAALRLDPTEAHTAARAGRRLTRLEAAVWLRRSLHLPTARDRGWSDVPASSVFRREIAAASAAIPGLACTATRFCPDQLVTRAQLARWVATIVARRHSDVLAAAPRARFADYADSRTRALAGLLRARYKVPFTPMFRPGTFATRRDVAQWTSWLALDTTMR